MSQTSNTNGTSADAATTTDGNKSINAHLWEESWDDDDEGTEDFASMLKEELRRVDEGGK